MRRVMPAAAVAAFAVIGGFLLLETDLGSREAQAVSVLPGPPRSANDRLVEIAQAAIRGRLRQQVDIAFNGVEVFRFGPVDERAVCGMVQAGHATGNKFVLRILLPRDHPERPISEGQKPVTVLEQGPGLIHADAAAAQRYCRDADAVVAAAPAMPIDAEVAPVASSAVHETVLVRSAARVRNAPGGEVVRVAVQGESLGVFGRAPGGWLQVGDGTPQGWVHSSMLVAGR